ncbi:MAG: MGH1-like glycoside hydrolase domain-containing protein, partial [Rhodospirillales bacterium]
ILIAIGVTNRGPEAAALTVLPTIWFRNTWSWSDDTPKPNLKQVEKKSATSIVAAVHAELGVRYLYCAGAPPALFTENETNNRRLFGGDNAGRFVKDGINDNVVGGAKGVVNPKRTGTKAAVRYDLVLEPGESLGLRLRLADGTPASSDRAGGPFVGFEAIMAARRAEADAFYAALLPGAAAGNDGPGAAILRRSCAGMLWNAQFYYFDAARWLGEHGAGVGLAPPRPVRNTGWGHLANADVITVPDKWEYPWYAAWNLAFHGLPLALVDAELAKRQLTLLLDGRYLHPNGKLPASEWDFSASEPPLHAWAVWSVYGHDKSRRGSGDLAFLRKAFPGLLMNFTWWANRVDADGRDLLSGGLVAVDAMDVFDRKIEGGGRLETSTGSAWMAFCCAQMLQIAVELALDDPDYERFAVTFFDHLMSMAHAMEHMAGGGLSLWNEADGWYDDLVRGERGAAAPLGARGFAGLVPMLACAVLPGDAVERLPRLEERLRSVFARHPDWSTRVVDPGRPGQRDRRLVAVVGEARLRRLLSRVLDEAELLSPFGIRSLSRAHLDAPARLVLADESEITVPYDAGEAKDALCAGNVNWRGPVWLPQNVLLIHALLRQYLYYGNRLRLECPTGSGQRLTLYEVAEFITTRLAALFRPDANGVCPALRGPGTVQPDPHWRDLLLFHEYFHG